MNENLFRPYDMTLEERIQEFLDYQKEGFTKQLVIDIAAKLAAAEKIFNHFGGLSELSKWENAGGETAANVVQEYLEL